MQALLPQPLTTSTGGNAATYQSGGKKKRSTKKRSTKKRPTKKRPTKKISALRKSSKKRSTKKCWWKLW